MMICINLINAEWDGDAYQSSKLAEFKMECPQVINISEFRYKEIDTPVKYRLIGMVTHIGDSDSSGHYVTYRNIDGECLYVIIDVVNE